MSAKDNNLAALRDKLKEKNERIVEADRLLESVNTELQILKNNQTRAQEVEDTKHNQTCSVI